MKLIYGVHGYGQGHATRSLAVLSALTRNHEVLILAGGDAYDAIRGHYDVVPIPVIAYRYSDKGRRSAYLTVKHALPILSDLFTKGRHFRQIRDRVRDFAPHVVISDAEIWTHGVAAHLGIPRIGFDHFGIMVHCRPATMTWLDRLENARDAWLYRTLMGRPDRVLVSSFFDAPPVREGVRVIGTLLRQEVYEIQPEDGEHLLVYLNQGHHLFEGRIARALHDLAIPVRVYGTRRTGTDGNLTFRPRSSRGFLEDLAGCRAVLSTAGNQLVGEALHFGKPMLVVPEECVEQRINGCSLQRAGIGMCVPRRRLGTAVIRRFLDQREVYRKRIAEHARDGRAEAIAAIELFLSELSQPRPAPHVARTPA